MAQEATPAPVQIFAIVKGGLTFHKEALREIINKIPKDQKVAIVSVNGAFRTGKSFLLNTFLRCLQHGNTAYREKDWLGGEVNASLLPGHPERPAQNTSGFEWRGGQGGVTTGIWMWSEPLGLMISNQDSPRLVSVLLMDTQGLDDTRMSQAMNNVIFAMSTLMSSYQIYNVSGQIAENNISNLAVFSVFAASARVNEAEATSARVNETQAKQFQIIEFLVRDCAFIEDGMTSVIIESETAEQLSLVSVGGDGTPATAPDPAAEGQMITREQINQCFKKVDCFLLPHPGLGVASPTYQGDLSVMNSFFRDRLIAYTNHVFSNLQPKIINERELSASELLAFIECYAAAFSNSGNYVSLVPVNIFNATIDAHLRIAYESSLEMYRMEMMSSMSRNTHVITLLALNNCHEKANKKALDNFDKMANVGTKIRIAEFESKLMEQIAGDFKNGFWWSLATDAGKAVVAVGGIAGAVAVAAMRLV